MPGVLVDTHTIVWYLAGSPRLSAQAQRTLDATVEAGAPIYLCTISLVEMEYLVEGGRLSAEALRRLEDVLAAPDGPLELAPLDGDVVRSVRAVPREMVPDMPDRIIAATSVCLAVPLVTRDRRIRRALSTAIW